MFNNNMFNTVWSLSITLIKTVAKQNNNTTTANGLINAHSVINISYLMEAPVR